MDNERHKAIVAALEGGFGTESEEEFEEELETQSVEEDSDDSGEEELEEETVVEASPSNDADEAEVPEGHRVPYDRFKQINDQRHELRSQLAEKEALIAELQERMRSKRKPEPEYEEVDYFSDDYDEDSNESYDELTYLKEQNHAIQVKFAQMELEKEIAAAREQYPNVPADHIWEAIAQDGTQSAVEIAKQYSTWVAGVEEAAIARYLKEQGQEPAASAPPRPSRKQTAKSSRSPDEKWTPRTTDEAREAMIAYLRS